MTAIDIEAIEARAKAATPGPWYAKPNEFDDWGTIRANHGAYVAVAHEGIRYAPGYDERLAAHRRAGTDPTQHNMDFIASAITDIPALISALRESHAKIDELWRGIRERDSTINITVKKRDAEIERLREALKGATSGTFPRPHAWTIPQGNSFGCTCGRFGMNPHDIQQDCLTSNCPYRRAAALADDKEPGR